MSLRSSRCPKHPSQLVVGVCASCLRERLVVLVNLEGKGDANSSRSSSRHSLASEPITNVYEIDDGARDSGSSAKKKTQPGADGRLNSTTSGSSAHNVRRSMSFSEAKSSVASGREDAFLEAQLPDISPNHGRKKTLSSLFNMDDDNVISKAEVMEDVERKDTLNNNVNGFKADSHFTGSSSAPPKVLQPKNAEKAERKFRHGSFAERLESSSMFPVSEGSRPLSWFSSLFRRRVKKSRPKSQETIATFSANNGWEDARPSWEAARPSSWEQIRFSSWEGPRSSWEPARPSWEGFMRTSDGDSVFSGFDFFHDSLSEVREDSELECKGLQDFVGYIGGERCNNSGAATAGGGMKDGDRNASRSNATKQMLLKTPPSAVDRARSFVSANAMQLQRDVSTQTTPPRPPEFAEKLPIQHQHQQHHHHQQHHPQQQARSAPGWSKVLNKTFSNPMWAFRQKQKGKEEDTLGEADDQASTVSGSSFYESARESTHHASAKEYGMWNAYYSPVKKNSSSKQQQQQQKKHKEESVDRSRTMSFSPFSLENGLLRFYLTPVRSAGARGRMRHRGYGPWV